MIKKKRSNNKRKYKGLVAALDIGSTKVCCALAYLEEDAFRVVGLGQQLCAGVRAGVIVDMEAVEAAVLNAVHAAEEMAESPIKKVFVNVAGTYLTSQQYDVEAPLGGRDVEDHDVHRIIRQAESDSKRPDQDILHVFPLGYGLDGHRGIRDPRGMTGESLSSQVNIVTAASGSLKNLMSCVKRCHLNIADTVASSYAAGLATLVEDELDLGVTLVDMGGGVTSFASFVDGSLVAHGALSIGGAHVTSDIARGLSTSRTHAERLKTLYGSAIVTTSDDREMISFPAVGDDANGNTQQVSRAYLVSIIQPRIEETLELLKAQLAQKGITSLVGQRMVITGGASQLPGMREMASQILDKQVRLGRPLHIKGLSDVSAGPAFSTAAGLMHYAYIEHNPYEEAEAAKEGAWSQITRWIQGQI